MAEFVRDASSALTPTWHSDQIWRESLKSLSLTGMMGSKGSGMPIVLDPMLRSEAGETINYHFVPFADKPAILGQDSTIKGNEYSFDEFKTSVTIDEVNFPFKRKGRMTKQRSILAVDNELRRQVTQHFREYNENRIFEELTGITVGTPSSTYTAAGDTTDRVNGAQRCIRAGGTPGYTVVAEASTDNVALLSAMTTADTLTTSLIDRASVLARTSTPYKMSQIRVGPNGEPYYILLISPEAAYDLRRDPDWKARMLSVGEAGIESDPIAMGAMGVWNRVIVKESERIIKIVGSSETYARNLLLGADSLVLAWAQTLQTTEFIDDYGREYGVNGYEIRGETKLAYEDKTAGVSTDIDYGVMQVISAAN
jgi:N4-gp56 family major capsid protein